MKPLDPRLMKYVGAARKYVIFLGALGFCETVLVLAQCLLIAGSISPVIEADAELSDMSWRIAWLGIVFALRALLLYLREAYGHRAALTTIADLRARVVHHAGDVGERWLSQGHSSSTVTLVTSGLDDLEPYFVKFLPQLILTCTVMPVALIVIVWLDWISALAIVLCIPLVPLFMILIGRLTQNFASERLASMQRLGQQLLDLLAGLTTLKAVGREKHPEGRVQHLGDTYAATTMQTLYVAFLSGAVLEFLTTLSTALVAVEVGLRMVAGHMGLFVGLTIIMLTPEVFKPLRDVGTQFHASSNGVAATDQAFDILETPLPVVDGQEPCPDLSLSTIHINNLSVYAPGRETIAPAKLTATLRPGEITVLRGPSGSGKTTTTNVLMRFLDPDEGNITIGDVPLSAISRESLWNNITWVPQRPVLIPGTVAENIGGIVDEKTREAARLAGFDSVIETLPQGWNTMIGQGGVGLSVGQRQRLALTRALISERPVILLDEPSAHLDARSEEHVVESVQKLRESGRTVIVIAHRQALIGVADNIVDVYASTQSLADSVAQNTNGTEFETRTETRNGNQTRTERETKLATPQVGTVQVSPQPQGTVMSEVKEGEGK